MCNGADIIAPSLLDGIIRIIGNALFLVNVKGADFSPVAPGSVGQCENWRSRALILDGDFLICVDVCRADIQSRCAVSTVSVSCNQLQTSGILIDHIAVCNIAVLPGGEVLVAAPDNAVVLHNGHHRIDNRFRSLIPSVVAAVYIAVSL